MTGAGRDPRTDRELVLAFQEGERDAYEAIYARHHERVHRTCMRVLGNPSDAAEATQEAFLRGFRGMARFNGRYQLGAWLARIATNVSVDTLRARQRSVAVVASTDEVGEFEESSKRPDTAVEERVGISRTLGELAPLHAEALLLRAVEGLSHREMAERLEMTPAQVKSLLHRSRSSFKKAWDNVSGWALAPLAWFRPWRAKNSSADSVAATSPVTVMLLERVATVATAAVIAVAGLATDGSDLSGGSSEAPRHVDVPLTAPAEDPRVAREAVSRSAENTTTPAPVLEPDLVTGLIDVEQVLPEDFGGDDGGGNGGFNPNPNNKKPIERQVEQAIEDVQETLEDPPIPGPDVLSARA